MFFLFTYHSFGVKERTLQLALIFLSFSLSAKHGAQVTAGPGQYVVVLHK